MNSLSCEYVRDNLALLFTGNELDADNMLAIHLHLAECTECANRHAQTEHMFAALRDDTVEIPDEQSWRNLAMQSFNVWQTELSGAGSQSRTPLVIKRWLEGLRTRSVFSPALLPVYAAAAMLLLCTTLIVTYTGDQLYDSDAFYEQHFSGMTHGIVSELDNTAADYVVMGFAYDAQPGSFALGVQYAHAKQACSFAFEKKCSSSVQNLNKLLAGYPFYGPDGTTVSDTENRAELLASLFEVQKNIEKSISSRDADYFLYQFGVWAQDLGFASTLQIDSITEERERAGRFLHRAAQLNLARGVIDALTRIEALLSETALSAKDNESLREDLAIIYAILI